MDGAAVYCDDGWHEKSSNSHVVEVLRNNPKKFDYFGSTCDGGRRESRHGISYRQRQARKLEEGQVPVPVFLGAQNLENHLSLYSIYQIEPCFSRSRRASGNGL